MEKYYNDYNTKLEEPTPCNPYTEAETSVERGYTCPETDLVNIIHEIKRTLNLYFEYATPEYNYACNLEEGSPVLWDVDFVKDGKLYKICGVVQKIEFHANKYNGRLYSHSLNGVIPPEEEVVVRFDCSTENKSVLHSVNVAKIRRIKYSEANIKDEVYNKITLPRDAYAYMRKLIPTAYKTMIISLDSEFDCSETIVGDYCFADMVNLKKIKAKLSFPKLVTADYMFANDQSLTDIKLGEFPNTVSANNIFTNDRSLTEIEINMPKVRILDEAFKDCASLITVKLNDVSDVVSASNIFENDLAIKNITVDPNTINFDLALISPVLTDESLKNIIKGLKTDRSELEKISNTRTLTLCDNTLCPSDLIADVINAIVKGGWIINGLYSEDGSLEKLKPSSTTDDNIGLDKEYPDDLLDMYNDTIQG